MRRPHSLELVLDDAGDALVRAQWEALRAAGLPSQADHPSPTNAPHVTLVEAPAIPEAALDVAHVRLRGVLPATARVGGVLLLGRRRLTLARPVQVDDDVARRALAVRAQVPDRLHAGWLPHLTLARGLEPGQVPAALAALTEGGGTVDADSANGAATSEVRLVEVRRWNPDTGHTTTV
ncbi:2'-5' RNA ligase family protein [Nocardioides bruguierae]|uniref:2'-5' RNA ligase family protein n=1 Tax=Nocardioides bruguierae TaxID=2945102 RepID=A0A9X2ICM7_9ACTN|nr:2'-5' RNA ligase family protein [Nocardioides bruguierae]MCM0618876.1 hypothetical protein [Nocardioides bruguierae]